MFSTLAGAPCISVERKHKKGHRQASKQDKFSGYTTAEVLKLGKKQSNTLTRRELLALELYWNARLAAMGEDLGRGTTNWLTYEADIGVLDFFAEDKAYILPKANRGEIGQ